MREIKFRAWDKQHKEMYYSNEGRGVYFRMSKIGGNAVEDWKGNDLPGDFSDWMQYTGLKDKNGVAEVYEGDIIDEYGNIKGNIYQVDKGETDTVIQGFGTKTWCETYRRAILLGLKDAE